MVTRAVTGPIRIEIRIFCESGLLVIEPVLMIIVEYCAIADLAGIVAAVVGFIAIVAVNAAVIVSQALTGEHGYNNQ